MFYWATPNEGAIVLYKGYLGVRVKQLTPVAPATWAAIIGGIDACHAL